MMEERLSAHVQRHYYYLSVPGVDIMLQVKLNLEPRFRQLQISCSEGQILPLAKEIPSWPVQTQPACKDPSPMLRIGKGSGALVLILASCVPREPAVGFNGPFHTNHVYSLEAVGICFQACIEF